MAELLDHDGVRSLPRSGPASLCRRELGEQARVCLRQGRIARGGPSTVLDPDRGRDPLVQLGKLQSRIAELEAEIRARDDFLAIAAHELRNPMTPIAAWVELLSNLAR